MSAEFMTTRQVCDRFSVSRMWVWRVVADRGFPKPVYFGGRRKYFSISEVDAWVQGQIRFSRDPVSAMPGPSPLRANTGEDEEENKRIDSEMREAPNLESPICKNAEGFIYFVSEGPNVKIGWSDSWKKRVKALQTAHPRKLKVLAVIPGNMGRERALHARFAAHRLDGEWFSLHSDIVEFVLSSHDICVRK